MLQNVEEIALDQVARATSGASVTDVLGRSLVAGIAQARERRLRVEVTDDYAHYADLVRRHAMDRDPDVKPRLDRPGFAGFLVRDGERVVATSGYYSLHCRETLAEFLAEGLQRPEERTGPQDGLEPIPLAARFITGRIVLAGAFWIDPAYRSFTSLFPVLRDCMMPYVLESDNPDYMVSFIRERDAKRGRGLHMNYGLINHSPALRWRDYAGPGQDLMVRLIWADRLSLLNQACRIAVYDY